MTRDFEALSKTKFDLAVIGGGINGAATARDAALRGLKVVLIEARDFASGTSSRSSKLIHGGLRYLEQLEFKLVHEARRERRLLLKLAPHLARPVPFLLPIYKGDPYSPLRIRLGLTVYDLLGNLGRKDRHRMLTPAEAQQRIPSLRPDGLRAGAVYFDSETDDARLTLENAIDAADHGAVVLNYTEIRALSVSAGSTGHPQQVVTAEAEDRWSGRKHEITARFWVNAAGPWVDNIRALLPGYDGTRTVRLTKGTHIILPPVAGPFAVFAAILPGSRIFVMVPWHGHALLGTTDTDFEGDPATVRPDRADIEYLLNALNRVLRHPLTLSDVVGSFAGLRALAIQPGCSPSENTREYRFHRDAGAGNFISVCGGKLTTARALGEKLVDAIVGQISMSGSGPKAGARKHPTREIPLAGGHTGVFNIFVEFAAWEAVRKFEIPFPIAERIVKTYGSRWPLVLESILDDKSRAQPLPGSPTLLAAEVDFAIRHEMATNVEDFLLRRSGLNWLASSMLRDAAPAVAGIFAARFGWTAERTQTEIESFTRQNFVTENS
ncbi:MAG TPA: glycerol-3-phosphate dehydrogenase [Terriglobia bacterium]|nr:glycerol-3-phosphate dehydrogenase [Terriglobia bacterium]